MHYRHYTTASLVHMLLLTLSLHYVVHVYMYVHTYVHPCRLVRLLLCAFCPLCLSLQTCEDGGGPNVFGIASMDMT